MFPPILKLGEELHFSPTLYLWTCHVRPEFAKCCHSGNMWMYFVSAHCFFNSCFAEVLFWWVHVLCRLVSLSPFKGWQFCLKLTKIANCQCCYFFKWIMGMRRHTRVYCKWMKGIFGLWNKWKISFSLVINWSLLCAAQNLVGLILLIYAFIFCF